MEINSQLARLDQNKLIEIIKTIPHLTDKDRNELIKQIASDDIEIRKSALGKMVQSEIALADLNAVQSIISNINKKGMYAVSKQTIKTGSGQLEIEMKGGDTKLIIPVLIIIGIVIIAALAIVFLR